VSKCEFKKKEVVEMHFVCHCPTAMAVVMAIVAVLLLLVVVVIVVVVVVGWSGVGAIVACFGWHSLAWVTMGTSFLIISNWLWSNGWVV
jgi:hypothetical protein